MQVSYGPPGHKGVTHLMAVGADEYIDESSKKTDRLVDDLLLGSSVVAFLGVLGGSSTLRNAGAGGFIALAILRGLSRVKQRVEVTAPVGRW